MNVIEVRDLRFKYRRSQRYAVDGVSLTVREGEFLGGPELAAPAFAALAGEDERVAYVTPYPLPGEEFAAAYRQVSGGVSPGMFSVTAYESAQLLLTALERDIAARGRPSRAGMRAALAEVLAERPLVTLTWR